MWANPLNRKLKYWVNLLGLRGNTRRTESRAQRVHVGRTTKAFLLQHSETNLWKHQDSCQSCPTQLSHLGKKCEQEASDHWQRSRGPVFRRPNHHYNTPTIWVLVSRKTLVLSKRHPKPHLEFENAPKGDCEKPNFLVCGDQNVTFWP